jgi:hypothetical protein
MRMTRRVNATGRMAVSAGGEAADAAGAAGTAGRPGSAANAKPPCNQPAIAASAMMSRIRPCPSPTSRPNKHQNAAAMASGGTDIAL